MGVTGPITRRRAATVDPLFTNAPQGAQRLGDPLFQDASLLPIVIDEAEEGDALFRANLPAEALLVQRPDLEAGLPAFVPAEAREGRVPRGTFEAPAVRTYEVGQLIRRINAPVDAGVEVVSVTRLKRRGWAAYVRRLKFDAQPGIPNSVPAMVRRVFRLEPGDVTTADREFSVHFTFPSETKEAFVPAQDWPVVVNTVDDFQIMHWTWRPFVNRLLTFVSRCYARALVHLGTAYSQQARNLLDQYLTDAFVRNSQAAGRSQRLRGIRMRIYITFENASENAEEARVFNVSSTWTTTNIALNQIKNVIQQLAQQYEVSRLRFTGMQCYVAASSAEAVRMVMQLNGQVGLGKNWVEVQDKYWIVSFRTLTQCALKSIAFLQLVFEKDRHLCAAGTWSYVVQLVSAKTQSLTQKLMQQFPETQWQTNKRVAAGESAYFPIEWLDMVAQYLGVTIVVFNNVFRKTHSFVHGSRLYEVMVVHDHMVACVPIAVGESNFTLGFRSLLYEQTFQAVGGDKRLDVLTTVGAELKAEMVKDKPVEFERPKEFGGPRVLYNWHVNRKMPIKPGFEFMLESAMKYLDQEWVYGTYDFETKVDKATNRLEAYALGYLVGEQGSQHEYDLTDVQTFWGSDCASRFLEDVHTQFCPDTEDPMRICLYAHNGGKFDVFILLTDALRGNLDSPWSFTERAMVVQDQTVVCLDLVSKVKPKFQLRFLDSLRLVPGTLDDLTRDFQVKHRKLKDAFRHEDVDEDWLAQPENVQVCEHYLQHDVLGLFEVVMAFKLMVSERFGLELAQCITAASLSKGIFLQKFYNPEWRIFNLPQHIDQIIRKHYFGGRCEVGYQGYVRSILEGGSSPEGPIFALDVTSFYPYCMLLDLPYGKYLELFKQKAEREVADVQNFFGYVHVLVRTTNKNTVPLHGIRLNGKLVFAHFDDWTEMVLFSEEYYAGLLHHGGYEYKILKAYKFERAPLLREFSSTLFKDRAVAKAEGKKALSLILKLILNSGYGWFAFRATGKTSVELHKHESFQHVRYMLQGVLKDFASFTTDNLILTVEKDIEVDNFNIAIGAAITSYARTRLWLCEKFIRDKGYHVFYKDTDCIHTNMDPNKPENHDWLRFFAADAFDANGNVDATTMGTVLGSFKSECNELKPYEKSKEIVGFDRAIYLAPKMYCLEKTFPNGYVKHKCASKGFSRRPPFVFKHLTNELYTIEGETIGVWDAVGRCFRSIKDNSLMIFNERVVNPDFEELDRTTLQVVFDHKGFVKRRGPPVWRDYEKMLEGETIERTMTSLALPFKTVMDKEETTMLREREIRRTVSIITEEGARKYGKGRVLASGFIEPLVISECDKALVGAFIEETPEEKELQDIFLQPLDKSTNETIVSRLNRWFDMFAMKDAPDEIMFDEEEAELMGMEMEDDADDSDDEGIDLEDGLCAY